MKCFHPYDLYYIYNCTYVNTILFISSQQHANVSSETSLKNHTVPVISENPASTVTGQQPARSVNGTLSRAQRKHHKHDRKSRAQNNKHKTGIKNKVYIPRS